MKENCLPFHEVQGAPVEAIAMFLLDHWIMQVLRLQHEVLQLPLPVLTCQVPVRMQSQKQTAPVHVYQQTIGVGPLSCQLEVPIWVQVGQRILKPLAEQTQQTPAPTLRGQQTLDGLQQRLDASGERNPFLKRTGIGSVRTEDPQASQRSTKLTEGIVKSVANPDMMCRMARGMQKALPFVPSRDDTASASETEVMEGEESGLPVLHLFTLLLRVYGLFTCSSFV
jgi:hypothetical protein